MEIPETRYAKTTDGVHIGFQVVGEGSADLVFVPYDYSNIEASWDLPQYVSFVSGLAAQARVLLFDRRGTGTSDRSSGDIAPPIEALMDDIRAVMDAAGSERACLFGIEGGAALCFVFAATYPERTAGVVAFGALARGRWTSDYPWGWKDEEWSSWFNKIENGWGSPAFVRELVELLSPSLADDPAFVRTMGRVLRLSASPGEALARDRLVQALDVRDILPSIQVPTFVIHRTGDRFEPVEEGRYIAERIPGATLLELPGNDHVFPLDDLVPHIAGFMRTIRDEEAEFDRVLATVLFTDIVGSTQKAAQLGDRGWGEIVGRHHAAVRALLARYRGTEVDTSGDGFFATFDGPARAVRCAQAIIEAVQPLGIDVRAGVHTGEVATIDTKVGGLAVVIGSRIASMATASEVLASSTVKDLTAGSGLVFEDTGEHELKGVPDRWRLHRVIS